jgi:hypothetical protein
MWMNLAENLERQGCLVLLVSPLGTHHERPTCNGDFLPTPTSVTLS